MKKSILILAMIFALVLSGCSAQQGSTTEALSTTGATEATELTKVYTPGTYEGEGTGHAGPIKLAVTVDENVITGIEVVEFNDSEFAVEPRDQLIEKVIEANSADVDGIAGASITSQSVLEAVNAALLQAYVNGAPAASEGSTPDEVVNLTDLETDVVIIGAGGAGLTAALSAHDAGADVIVVEKMPMIGGNTKYATGGINAAETSVQASLGIEDSVALFYEDTMTGGKNINDPELVKTLTENAKDSVEWLIEIGADLSDVGRLGGASANRAHRPTGGAPVGNHIVDVLYDNVKTQGIEVLLNSEVIEILGDHEMASGVVVKTEDGTYEIHAKAVVIASGGFGANNALVAQYRPEYEGYGTTNHPGATGDVVQFAEKLDLAYVDMEQIQTHPTVMPSNNYMITEAVRGNGAILVNYEGRRFINEIETRDVVSDAELSQTNQAAFLVFDQSVRESLSAIDGYYNKGFLLEGETVEALAQVMGIDAAALASTIETYNGYVASGNDSDFGREDMPRSLEVGPYYAVEVSPAVHHTMGGVKITTSGEVVNESGEIVGGLYAAGEVTGGVHGANRLGGNALADITTFGRIAGTNAAEYAAK